MCRFRFMLFIGLGMLVCLGGCKEAHYVPKPRTYPKIDFPKRSYETWTMEDCPFSFSVPGHARVVKTQTYFNEKPPHPCWFNLHYDGLAADIFMSYHEINQRSDYDNLISDVYRVVSQVNKRSDYMTENGFQNKYGASGIRFDFEGPAASPVQFFVTDTSSHFLKGALYFNTQARPDSLAPVTSFIKADIDIMLRNFRWK